VAKTRYGARQRQQRRAQEARCCRSSARCACPVAFEGQRRDIRQLALARSMLARMRRLRVAPAAGQRRLMRTTPPAVARKGQGYACGRVRDFGNSGEPGIVQSVKMGKEQVCAFYRMPAHRRARQSQKAAESAAAARVPPRACNGGCSRHVTVSVVPPVRKNDAMTVPGWHKVSRIVHVS